jgi:hypothetical protein
MAMGKIGSCCSSNVIHTPWRDLALKVFGIVTLTAWGISTSPNASGIQSINLLASNGSRASDRMLRSISSSCTPDAPITAIARSTSA